MCAREVRTNSVTELPNSENRDCASTFLAALGSARLYHVNIDLGSVGLLELRSHFRFQFPRIDSRWNVEDENHLSLVFVKRRALKSAMMRDKQRLHHAKNRLRIDVVLEPDPDPAAGM